MTYVYMTVRVTSQQIVHSTLPNTFSLYAGVATLMQSAKKCLSATDPLSILFTDNDGSLADHTIYDSYGNVTFANPTRPLISRQASLGVFCAASMASE